LERVQAGDLFAKMPCPVSPYEKRLLSQRVIGDFLQVNVDRGEMMSNLRKITEETAVIWTLAVQEVLEPGTG
jgi:hypothetical protein